MSSLFLKIVNMSIAASWLILAVVLLRVVLKKAPKWINVLLWGIVAFRLICPFSFESALSLIPSAETISPEIMMDWTPEISTGVSSIDKVVNPIITDTFAPEPIASANPLQLLIPVLAIVWAIGIIAMLVYAAVSYFRLQRKSVHPFLCEIIFGFVTIYKHLLFLVSSNRASTFPPGQMKHSCPILLPMRMLI